MLATSAKPILSVTTFDVAAWQDEIAAIRANMAVEERRVAHLRKLLESVDATARLMSGEAEAAPSIAPSSEHGITSGTTLVAAIKLYLRTQPLGCTPREVSDALKQTPVAPKLIRSAGAIYTAIKRLVGLGEIVQYGSLLYIPDAFQRVRNGLVVDPRYATAHETKPEMRSLVLGVIGRSEGGMTALEVRDALADDPHYGNKVRARPNYIYNILHRMIESTQLRRDGNRYLLEDTKTPPSG